jgi:hypothetical protein
MLANQTERCSEIRQDEESSKFCKFLFKDRAVPERKKSEYNSSLNLSVNLLSDNGLTA